jgi:hypothetical protein
LSRGTSSSGMQLPVAQWSESEVCDNIGLDMKIYYALTHNQLLLLHTSGLNPLSLFSPALDGKSGMADFVDSSFAALPPSWDTAMVDLEPRPIEEMTLPASSVVAL